jgi:hypothetical protein
VVAALPFFWWLVLIFFWVIFLMLTMNIARSKVTAAPMGSAGLHPPAGYRHHPAIAPASFTGVACDLTAGMLGWPLEPFRPLLGWVSLSTGLAHAIVCGSRVCPAWRSR